MYAIVEIGGRQVRIEPGKEAVLDYHPGIEPGADILLDKVLILGGEEPRVGAPYLEDVKIKGTVTSHFKGKKIIAFRFKKRKNIRVRKGFRAQYTRVMINDFGEE